MDRAVLEERPQSVLIVVAEAARQAMVVGQFGADRARWTITGVGTTVEAGRRLLIATAPDVLAIDLAIGWLGEQPGVQHGLDLLTLAIGRRGVVPPPHVVVCGVAKDLDATTLIAAIGLGARAILDPTRADVTRWAARVATRDSTEIALDRAADATLRAAGFFGAANTASGPDRPLGADERRLLTLLTAGADRATLATALGVPPNTLKNRQVRLFRHLGLATRADAFAYAHEHLTPEEIPLLAASQAARVPDLGERERRLLQCLMAGDDLAGAARELALGVPLTRAIRRRLYAQLGVATRGAAIRAGRQAVACGDLSAVADDRSAPMAWSPTAVVVREYPAAQARPTDLLGRLTPRQREILALRAAGSSNDAVIIHLGISLSTLKGTLASLRKRLGVTNTAAALALYAAARMENDG